MIRPMCRVSVIPKFAFGKPSAETSLAAANSHL